MRDLCESRIRNVWDVSIPACKSTAHAAQHTEDEGEGDGSPEIHSELEPKYGQRRPPAHGPYDLEGVLQKQSRHDVETEEMGQLLPPYQPEVGDEEVENGEPGGHPEDGVGEEFEAL